MHFEAIEIVWQNFQNREDRAWNTVTVKARYSLESQHQENPRLLQSLRFIISYSLNSHHDKISLKLHESFRVHMQINKQNSFISYRLIFTPRKYGYFLGNSFPYEQHPIEKLEKLFADSDCYHFNQLSLTTIENSVFS